MIMNGGNSSEFETDETGQQVTQANTKWLRKRINQ